MITCIHCRHFQPDAINPPAGMGRCMHEARHGYWYPTEKHVCNDHEERERAESPQRSSR
jgi:hypothetical protein